MRKKLLSIVAMLFTTTQLFSQNPTWVMAPSIAGISNLQSLPITSTPTNDLFDPFDYYDGWSALQGSNGISDVVTGTLKFFIIDGVIYDGADGQYKDYAWSATQPNVENIGAFNQPLGDGGSEQLIVPHPVNCNQYYIFGVATVWSGDTGGQKALPGYASSVPVYAIYDAETGLIIERGVWYEPSPSFLGITFSNPIFTAASTSNPSNTNGDLQVTAAVWDEDCSMSTAAIAGSQLLADGSRIIACKMKNNLYSIKILPDGSLRYWKRYNHSAIIAGSQTKAEFEMVFDDVSNTFKLALESRNSLGSAFTYCVKYFELSDNFLSVANFQTINVPVVGNGSSAVKPLAGIEFSPNKNTIYFTCSTDLIIDLNNPQPVSQRVYTIDLTNSTYPVTPFAISQTRQDNIQNGHIEVALDGNMYFASATGLYRLTDPNTPDANNFSPNPIISFTYLSNLGINSEGSTFVSNNYLTSFTLPGQIDDADYTAEYNKNTECCINQSPFDATSFTATTSATWVPGGFSNNPFGSTSGIVRIETAITIPAGVNITITGMTFQFAPGARIIVREGNFATPNGGSLTLNNSVLTNYEGCRNTMWHGVEVWGVSSASQGSLASSRQARLIMTNNARIENALFGAAARATNVTSGAELAGRYGGIIRAARSTFLNNQYDVLLYNYGSQLVNNISRFTNCLFKTDGLLNDPAVLVQTHMNLRSVRGIRVLDCDFVNADLSFYPIPMLQGIGIGATNSSFLVDGCPNYSNSCSPANPNIFKNLFIGIFSNTSGSNASFRADGNIFENNCLGIYVTGTRSEQITRNKFSVREFLNTASPIYQSAGIFALGSTGYRIEDNSFEESDDVSIPYGSGNSYGVVIRNSGPNENVVYRNTFTNLYIGCQSEGVNGSAPLQFPGMSNVGLVWKCNEFYKPIYKNDITSFNGKIKYRQGFYNPSNTPMQNQLNMANNRFSLIQEAITDPQHDFQISPVVGQNGIIYTGYSQIHYNLDAYTTPIISQTIIATTFLPLVGCKSNFGAASLPFNDKPVSSAMMEQMNSILSLRAEDSLSFAELNLLEIGAKQLEKNLRVQEILFDTTVVNVDSVLIEYLSHFSDEESLKMLAELQLTGSDVDSLVASLETDSVKFSNDYVDLLKIKAEMLNAEDFYSFLINDENSESLTIRLSEIAANEDDVLTAHQASLLLSFVKPFNWDYSFAEYDVQAERSMSISSKAGAKELVVYPNPVKNSLSVNLTLAENEKVSASIFSVLGVEMGTWELSNENNVVDVNHFQGGIYLIQIKNAFGEYIQTIRFVKQ